MDGDHVTRLLEEIRDLQRQLLASHEQARNNQEAAIAEQRAALGRGRRLQAALGVVIAVVLVVVVLLLRYVLQRFS